MAMFKCKMCGGSLEVSDGMSVVECEYCGTNQTLPTVTDDRKANLYNRANHFRRSNDFDKALSAYERILNEDNSDAEAHWGALLSKYGIEYVEDPSTKVMIPTCHRVQVESILSDSDYLLAVENAPDITSKDLYQKQASEISEVQKGILAISQNEEPFDVFICYKESNENGSRTKDSTLAQDIYYQLTQQGLKVFFARITLEDKIGREYEPYIFAALNSAKVMVVLGTKEEYFNATWVKNEWSRYLKIVKNDRSKLIIPCYMDMDAYDLPEELSMLQSQDMSKIGFIQDLIRGIGKASKKEHETPQSIVPKNTQISTPTIESLLKRAWMFLKDKDWENTNIYCDKVLDINPELAEAYYIKLHSEYKVTDLNYLNNSLVNVEKSKNYEKIISFSSEEMKSKVINISNNQKNIIEKELNLKTNTINELNLQLNLVYEKLKKHEILINDNRSSYDETDFDSLGRLVIFIWSVCFVMIGFFMIGLLENATGILIFLIGILGICIKFSDVNKQKNNKKLNVELEELYKELKKLGSNKKL